MNTTDQENDAERNRFTMLPRANAFEVPISIQCTQSSHIDDESILGEGSNSRSVPILSQLGNNVPLMTSPAHKLESKIMPEMPILLGHKLSATIIGKLYASSFSDEMVCFTSHDGPMWEVQEGLVHPVPPHYTIEKSAVFVEGSSPSQVAIQISECLGRRSISASYGKTKAKAKCTTADGVEFRIRLFTGWVDDSQGIIVEVQRRCGWSVAYQQDCFAILDAAKGIEFEENLIPTSLCGMDNLDAQNKTDSDLFCLGYDLLEDGKEDFKFLGLQMPCESVCERVVGPEKALGNSHNIMDLRDKMSMHMHMHKSRLMRNYMDTSDEELKAIGLRGSVISEIYDNNNFNIEAIPGLVIVD